MRINTNVAALTAQEASTNTNKLLTNSLEKLSTGLKINKASDDASGLSIADKLRTQATSINQGIDNGNSAVALLQITDKAMAEQSQILDTIKAKLIQANTDTTSTDGQVAIAKDIDKLLDQVNNIALQTNYNGRYLLANGGGTNGRPLSVGDLGTGESLSFQIGEKATDVIATTAINAFVGAAGSVAGGSAGGLGLGTFHGIAGNLANASAGALSAALGAWNASAGAGKILAQTTVDDAITVLNGYRADAGSTQNQVESAIRNLMTQSTNVQAAESIIRDVDYAAESANFNKQNIIAQAGTYAMSQANSISQNVLRLLQ